MRQQESDQDWQMSHEGAETKAEMLQHKGSILTEQNGGENTG